MINDAVFALFRANVRIIDHALRSALARVLFENVTSTAPGEKLDEKLASLTFSMNGGPDRKHENFLTVDRSVHI